MQPTIDFHGIASIDLSPVLKLKTDTGCYFVTRTMTLRDADGQVFRIGLFAQGTDTAALMIDAERTLRDQEVANDPRA